MIVKQGSVKPALHLAGNQGMVAYCSLCSIDSTHLCSCLQGLYGMLRMYLVCDLNVLEAVSIFRQYGSTFWCDASMTKYNPSHANLSNTGEKDDACFKRCSMANVWAAHS